MKKLSWFTISTFICLYWFVFFVWTQSSGCCYLLHQLSLNYNILIHWVLSNRVEWRGNKKRKEKNPSFLIDFRHHITWECTSAIQHCRRPLHYVDVAINWLCCSVAGHPALIRNTTRTHQRIDSHDYVQNKYLLIALLSSPKHTLLLVYVI